LFNHFISSFYLQPEHDRDGDATSESDSFQAAAWEEERSKRSLVKWAGGGEGGAAAGTGQLRRAPTPFPKEMRAMAKRAQGIREKKRAEEVAEGHQVKRKVGKIGLI
jgi:hypothetical protein